MASRERAAVPRQRGDKTRTPSAAPPDAVPGRLCEAQWLSVLAAEERDDAVGDVVAELLGAVAERCFRAELSRQVGGTAGPSAAAAWGAVGAEWASQRRRAAPCPQCAPFAVDWARAELLQAVAWRFLVRDEGDAAPEAAGAWREDEEPLPCADDAWAEGAVPVLPACPTPAHGEVMRPFPPHPRHRGFLFSLRVGPGWGSQLTPMGHHSPALSSPALPFPREAGGCALHPRPQCRPCALSRSPAPARMLSHPRLRAAVCQRLPPHCWLRTRCSMLPSPPKEYRAAPLCQPCCRPCSAPAQHSPGARLPSNTRSHRCGRRSVMQ